MQMGEKLKELNELLDRLKKAEVILNYTEPSFAGLPIATFDGERGLEGLYGALNDAVDAAVGDLSKEAFPLMEISPFLEGSFKAFFEDSNALLKKRPPPPEKEEKARKKPQRPKTA